MWSSMKLRLWHCTRLCRAQMIRELNWSVEMRTAVHSLTRGAAHRSVRACVRAEAARRKMGACIKRPVRRKLVKHTSRHIDRDTVQTAGG